MKYLFLIIFIGTFVSVEAQEERRFIRKGTTLFNDSAYLESEIEYRKALDKTGDSFEAQFNLGDALFRQEKFDEAIDQFQILAGTEKDADKLAQVHHNIGNSYFAMQKFQESVEAYKESLRNNPEDHETRYNLIAAQKMLQQQQQDQQNQDQDKDQQDQQDQQQQDQQQKDQQDQQQNQEQQEQDQQNQQQNQQQQQPEEQMSKEDAQRLLNAIQQDENKLQEKLRKAKATQKTKSGKNW